MSDGSESFNQPLSDDAEVSPADALDDNQAFADLDRYVEAMHRLDEGQRAQFMEDHPELLPLLACLDTLDSIAPIPAAPVPMAAEPTAAEPTDVIDANARTLLSSSDELTEASVDILGITPVHPNEFGKYELQGELGRGGMGVVYKARQTDLDLYRRLENDSLQSVCLQRRSTAILRRGPRCGEFAAPEYHRHSRSR